MTVIEEQHGPEEHLRVVQPAVTTRAARGLRAVVPPSPDAAPATPDSNLPAQLTSFIGRREELAATQTLLEGTRLLTLTGSGGCGKTRLALQLASDRAGAYPDGVWWADLGPLARPDLVPNAVANALGLQEVPFQSFAERLTAGLRDKTLLLVLDNCEHLIDPCADLVDPLLRGCPSLTIIVTSREPLGVDGETAWRVPSLSLPDQDAARGALALDRFDAVRLFVERAVKARPTFRVTDDNAAAVAEICRRLDGIPLAIELAAARTRLLSPEQIAQGLADRFRLLTGGARTAVPRQQTLIASVEWSYKLLSETEKALLRRLAVFAGSFTLDAAESVCSDETIPTPEVLDLLAALVDKSLLQIEEPWSPVRYRMLETIRQYANQKLIDSEEMPALRDRHLDLYVSVAERERFELEEGSDFLGSLERLDLEHDNLRTAMEWARSSDPDKGMRVARGLWPYWYSRGLFSEGISHCEAAASSGGGSGALKARVLASGAVLASSALDANRAAALADESFRLAREAGDRIALLEALYAEGSGYFNTHPEKARTPLLEALALAQEMDRPFWVMRATYGLAVVELNTGNLGAGRRLLEESLRISKASELRVGRTLILYWSAAAAWDQGDLDEAESFVAQALDEARRIRNVQFECLIRGIGVATATVRAKYEEAHAALAEVWALSDSHPHPVVIAVLPYPEEMLNYAESNLDTGGGSLDTTLAFLQAIEADWLAGWILALKAEFKRARGELAAAEELAGAGLKLARSSGNSCCLGRALRTLANVRRADGHLDSAEDLYHEALRHSQQAGAKLDLVMTLEGIAGIAADLGSWEESTRLLAAADALRDLLGAVRFIPDQQILDRDKQRARENLEADTFERAWLEGAGMSIEETISYAVRGRGERKRPSSGWNSLTPAEIDVVHWVTEGLTNPQIGERLFIAPGTVKNHLSHIFAKLGVSTRAELAAEAARRKL